MSDLRALERRWRETGDEADARALARAIGRTGEPIPEVIARSIAKLVEPVPDLDPSEWAERFRVLSEDESEVSGPWRNSFIPCLAGCMDAAREAIDTGKLGVALLKPAQMGGTDQALNVLGWGSERLPGNVLYLTATDDVATEVARKRIDPLIQGCEPLRGALISHRGSGKKGHIRRFPRGTWTVAGSQTPTPFESTPRRIVIVDEVDRCRLIGGADPVETARTRTQAYRGPTLIYALGHPTTADRGIGALYYNDSDQRRGFVPCPFCERWFWLDWDAQVTVRPRGKEPLERARMNPSRYVWVTPCCKQDLTDPKRWSAARDVEQRSTLSPEAAALKLWIGIHISQFLVPGKLLEEFVALEIAARDRPTKMRVFQNKVKGDVDRGKSEAATIDDWRAAVIVRGEGKPPIYRRGEVPTWVQRLTAAVDLRKTEAHWSVFGWGILIDKKRWRHFIGALVAHGEIELPGARRPIIAADLAELDGAIFDRGWERVDGSGSLHVRVGAIDSGWRPAPVYEYCLRRLQRGARCVVRPCKGYKEEPTSEDDANLWTFGAPVSVELAGGKLLRDPRMKLFRINTHDAKDDISAMVRTELALGGGVESRQLWLPEDVGDDFLQHCVAERPEPVSLDGTVLAWKSHGRPNHYFDTVVYNYALGRSLEPMMGYRTKGEQDEQAKRQRAAEQEAGRDRRPGGDRSGGGSWLGIDRDGGWVTR